MNPKKIAVIGIPGKWSTEVLADAIEERTGYRQVIAMSSVFADLQSGKLLANDINLCELDAIAVKKINQQYSPDTLDRIEILRMAESAGVRVFSSPQKIVRMIDRLACTMTLSAGNIPLPPTVITEDIDIACNTVFKYGEAVCKPLYSTKAKGMELISANDGETAVRTKLQQFQSQNSIMYIQKKLDLSGRDYGMVFLGGDYIGSYARVSQSTDWSTVIDKGGKYMPFTPDNSIVELASRAQSLFNMDFTTVDVAQTKTGPVIFEVSAFGGFKGVKEALGMDAAAMYSDYIIRKISA